MNVKIKIDKKNATKIEDALAEVNGRAASFTVRHFEDIAMVVADAEKRLDELKLAKSDRNKVTASFTPAGPYANAYNGTAISTRITILANRKGEWFLVEISRTTVYPKNREKLTLAISEEQKERILANMLKDVSVIQPELVE